MLARSLVWIGSLLLVLATLGGMAGLGWYKYQAIMAAASTPPPPEMPVSVRMASVEMAPFRKQTTVIGTVMAPRSITVSNEIPGTVVEASFEPGGIVDEGQILIRLDSRMESAQLLAAEARLRLAETTLKRLRSIRGADAISQIELDEAVARRDEAAASVAEFKAMIQRRSIHAPFRARAGLSDTHAGQYLPAGSTITTLQSLDGYLLIDFMLPQEVADVVRVGDPVMLDSLGRTWDARIVAFESLADRHTRNLKVRARIDSPPENMQPGDSVRTVVRYGPELTTTTVPIQAVRRSPGGAFVYVATDEKDGTVRARSRTVQVGPADGKRIHVLTGIDRKDRVITDGSFKLRDGVLIVDADKNKPHRSDQSG